MGYLGDLLSISHTERDTLMHTSRKAFLALVVGLTAFLVPPPAQAGGFQANALDTYPADPSLQNPWGISASPGGSFWISDNGTHVSTLLAVNPTTDATTKLGLTVSIPGEGSVTGQVYNSTKDFNADPFLFVSEDGTVSGWRGSLGTSAETLQAASLSNVYKGSAIATVGTSAYLYAANFRAGTIDVLKGNVGAPSLTGTFTDPTMASGYAPFNVQNLGGNLFVTYAQQNAAKHDDVAGAGHGFVDEFDLNGTLVKRIAGGGALDSPWGLAIAPSSLGSFTGDLLVGNFGDGRINAFDLAGSGGPTALGQLPGAGSVPLTIDGLWALSPGNNGSGGSSQKLYFTSGPNGETGGVFGVLAPVPEASSLVTFGLLLTLGGIAAMKRKKRA